MELSPSLGENVLLTEIAKELDSQSGFTIPPHNQVDMQYSNSSFPTKPTYITFKRNGTPVYYLYLNYDANGAVTSVGQD
jgi:hypothetical protein